MNHTVRYIGGPKGGEIQAFPDRPPMRIQTLAARDLRQIYHGPSKPIGSSLV